MVIHILHKVCVYIYILYQAYSFEKFANLVSIEMGKVCVNLDLLDC